MWINLQRDQEGWMVIDILDIIVAYESYDVSPKSWDQVFTLKNETLQQAIGPAN